MRTTFFESDDEIALVLRDFQPLVSFFAGDECQACGKTANLPPGMDWTCPCGHWNLNMGMIHHPRPAYAAPDLGPPLHRIDAVFHEVNSVHVVGYGDLFHQTYGVFVGADASEEARAKAEEVFAIADEPQTVMEARITPFWFTICDPYVRRMWHVHRLDEVGKVVKTTCFLRA